MTGMEICRAQTLSAPNCTMMIGDPVFARRGPAEPEFRGRVVSRAFGRHVYDVETADGEVICDLTLVWLDEEALAIRQAAEALDAPKKPVFPPSQSRSRTQPENGPFARGSFGKSL